MTPDFRFRLDDEYPVALHWALGMGYQSDTDFPALVPFSLVPSSKELAKWAEFMEFKISTIELIWVPSVKGRPLRVDVEEAGQAAINYGNASTAEALVVFPPNPPAIGGGLAAANQAYWSDLNFNVTRAIKMADLPQMRNPRPRRVVFQRGFKIRWGAKVIKGSAGCVMAPTNTTLSYGTPSVQRTTMPDKWVKMPWMPLITPQQDSTQRSDMATGTGGTGAQNLSVMLRQPYIAVRDTKTWSWFDDNQLAQLGVYGKFYLKSTWWFRKRRPSTSQQVVRMTPQGLSFVMYGTDLDAYAPVPAGD